MFRHLHISSRHETSQLHQANKLCGHLFRSTSLPGRAKRLTDMFGFILKKNITKNQFLNQKFSHFDNHLIAQNEIWFSVSSVVEI